MGKPSKSCVFRLTMPLFSLGKKSLFVKRVLSNSIETKIMLNSQENLFCSISSCLRLPALSNGITAILLNSTEPNLNLCSLFGKDLVQFSYLDRIKGLRTCFSTTICSSLLPPKTLQTFNHEGGKKKSKQTFDFESRSFSQEKPIGYTLSFWDGGGWKVKEPPMGGQQSNVEGSKSCSRGRSAGKSLKNDLDCRLTLFGLCWALSRLLAVGTDQAFANAWSCLLS